MEKNPKRELKVAPEGRVGPARGRAAAIGPTPRPAASIRTVDLADAMFAVSQAEQAGRQPERSVLKAWLDAEKASGNDELLGILGPCVIPGCDVHILTLSQDDILDHIEGDESVPAGFESARDYLAGPDPGAVAALIYADHFDVLFLDGSRRRGTG